MHGVNSVKSVPTFRYNVSILSLRVKQSKDNTNITRNLVLIKASITACGWKFAHQNESNSVLIYFFVEYGAKWIMY
jgi:hypothetical protein